MMMRRKGSQYSCYGIRASTTMAASIGARMFRALATTTVAACLLLSLSSTTIGGFIGILRCQAFVVPNSAKGKGSPITQSSRVATAPTTTKTLLNMNFFSDLFGSFQEKVNTGGSYNLGIDYDALDFPGPEVGAMAVSITRTRKEAFKTGTAPPIAPSLSPSMPHLELATVAGGCFWGLELALQRHEGIVHTLVGYTQGEDNELRPNYEQVAAGNTGHCEAVLVYFDPSTTSYETVLRLLLDRVDITTVDGQGGDFGRQYRTGIYFHTPSQEETAKRLLSEEIATNLRYKNKPVATEVEPAKAFWPAEAYHQKYLEKGGRFGQPQSAEKGSTDEIRCYG